MATCPACDMTIDSVRVEHLPVEKEEEGVTFDPSGRVRIAVCPKCKTILGVVGGIGYLEG